MKFEKVTGYDYVNFPVRKTEHSAGYDIESAETVTLMPFETALIKTGIKAEIDEGKFLALYMRSSISLKRNLIMTNSVGIIDKDYYNNEDNEGHIHFMITNLNNEPVTIKRGERIGQGVLQDFYKVDDDNAMGERLGGFGSTDKGEGY